VVLLYDAGNFLPAKILGKIAVSSYEIHTTVLQCDGAEETGAE